MTSAGSTNSLTVRLRRDAHSNLKFGFIRLRRIYWNGISLLIFILRAYKNLVSPYLPGTCRFYPSCSQYATEALERHGFLKGASLSLGRLLKCNPFSQGGYDPVP